MTLFDVEKKILSGKKLTPEEERMAVEWDDVYEDVYGPLGSYDLRQFVDSLKYPSIAEMRKKK